LKNIKKIIILDFLAIQSYLTFKNFAIYFVFAMLYGLISKTPITVLYTLSFAAVLYSSYPYFVGDESGIDALYKIFGIQAKSVVFGRYIFMYLMNLCAILMGIIMFLMINLALKQPVQLEGWISLSAGFLSIFLVSTGISLLQFPLFFKFGYAKGKILTIMPMMLVVILTAIVMGYFGDYLKKMNLEAIDPISIISFVGVVYLIVLVVSIRSSIFFYLKKEL